MKAIALDPEYSRKTARQFIAGGMAEAVWLSGKGKNSDVLNYYSEILKMY